MINKIDRQDARAEEVVSEVFDLFIDLDATDEQIDFPMIFTPSRATASRNANLRTKARRSAAAVRSDHQDDSAAGAPVDGVLQLLVANLDYNDYVGRLAIGRIFSGAVAVGDQVSICKLDGRIEKTKVTKLYAFEGMKRVPIERAEPARSSRSPASKTSTSARRFLQPTTRSRCRESPSTSRPSR